MAFGAVIERMMRALCRGAMGGLTYPFAQARFGAVAGADEGVDRVVMRF